MRDLDLAFEQNLKTTNPQHIQRKKSLSPEVILNAIDPSAYTPVIHPNLHTHTRFERP